MKIDKKIIKRKSNQIQNSICGQIDSYIGIKKSID